MAASRRRERVPPMARRDSRPTRAAGGGVRNADRSVAMKRFAALALIFSLALASSARGGESYRIGYSCSNFADTFQTYIVDAAWAEAEASGIGLRVMDAGEDAALQARHVEKMLADKADALIVVPVDTSAVDEIVAMAATSQVPLIFVNRNPFVGEVPPGNCYVIATDAFVEGETQMNYAAPIIGPMGHVVILQGILANEATLSRTEGVRSVIQMSYPELTIMAEASGNWQRGQGKDIMRGWLAELGRENIDAVISNNDDMALGALDALEEADIRDVVVVGIDAIPEALRAIKDGRMAGTVLQDPVLQGKGAVEIALRALRGDAQAQNVILSSEIVTSENIDTFLKP